VTKELKKIYKIRPDQIYILYSSLRISDQLPAPSVSGGGYRLWKVQFSELQRPRDLNLESVLTAYRLVSLIDLYVHTKYHWNQTNFLWTDMSPSNVIRTRRSRPNS